MASGNLPAGSAAAPPPYPLVLCPSSGGHGPDDRVFAALLDHLPGIVYVAEVGMHGRWLYVSPQIESMLGWTPQEWMADATLWAKSIHPEDRWVEELAELPQRTTAGGRHVSEYRMTTRDGHTKWFRDDATLLSNEHGELWAWTGVVTDITTQKETEEQLRHSDARRRAVIETAMDAYVAVDGQGLVCDWNQTAAEMLGWTRDEILGRPLTETVMPEYRELHVQALQRAMTSSTDETAVIGRSLELSAIRRDGTELPVEVTVWRTPGGLRDQVPFSAFLRDITDRKALQTRLVHEASHDDLTGLANRAALYRRLGEVLAGTGDAGIALLLIDLDDFKSVNDVLGHAAGDQLLRAIADRLRRGLPECDTVARLAGDEFAVLLRNVPNLRAAEVVAESLQACLRPPTMLAGAELSFRASIGIRHCAPGDAPPADELLADADLAMYTAKRRGQGLVAVFEPQMRADLERRAQLTEALEHAIARDQIFVHYQPYVSLADGRTLGVEALARWQHPQYGSVTPAEFIPLAESTGQIRPLGLFVLRQACRDITHLRQTLPECHDLRLSVNVSVRQLVDGELFQTLCAVLEETGLPGDALTLELTETAFLEDADAVAGWLCDIRDLGVHVAVDDFGTRYASLSYLQRFPIDTLKVDRSFVKRVHESPEEHRLTGAIVSLARTLGLHTIAEGVEEDEHARRLLDLGCDVGQGFLFARPVALEHLYDLLRSRADAAKKRYAAA